MSSKCKSCPIHPETEEGVLADSYGCLPSYAEALKWKRDTGKIWACHSNPKKPCGGFLRAMGENGEAYDLSNDLITEDSTLEEIYENVDDTPQIIV